MLRHILRRIWGALWTRPLSFDTPYQQPGVEHMTDLPEGETASPIPVVDLASPDPAAPHNGVTLAINRQICLPPDATPGSYSWMASHNWVEVRRGMQCTYCGTTWPTPRREPQS